MYFSKAGYRLELADIFLRYGPEYRAKYKERMLPGHLRAMQDIEQCRTESKGGHVYLCNDCDRPHYSYHSCKNRHCPKCCNDSADLWLLKQQKLLLPVDYFMVTFTLPEELRMIVRSNQKTMYSLMFETSAAALKKLALDPRFIGGHIGMVGVLQSWTRDLNYHPHIHYIVPGGGLSSDNKSWLSSRKDFLVRVEPLSVLFKGMFRDKLQKAGLIDSVSPDVWKKDWVVNSKPVGSGQQALKYLAPYVYRIAISNNRLLKLENNRVTFKFKNSDTNQWKYMTLDSMEFIRRFLQHVLPEGFPKVRYYGFLSPGHRKDKLNTIRTILGHNNATESLVYQKDAEEDDRQDKPALRCLHCGGSLRLFDIIKPHKREPP